MPPVKNDRAHLKRPGSSGVVPALKPAPKPEVAKTNWADAKAGAPTWLAAGKTKTPDPYNSVSNADATATIADPTLGFAPDAQTSLRALQNSPRAFTALDATLKGDPKFVKAALRENPDVFAWLDPAMQKDPAVAQLAVALKPELLKSLDPALASDPKLEFIALRSDPSLLPQLSSKDDSAFLEAAITEQPEVMQFVDAGKRDDPAFMKPYLERSGGFFAYAGPTLKQDVALAKKAVVSDPDLLRDKDIRNQVGSDRTVMLEAAKNDGASLEFMPRAMQNDKDIVLAAVTSYRGALQFASDELKGDREVVTASVAHSAESIGFAREPAMGDPAFMAKLAKADPRIVLELTRDLASFSCIKQVLAADPELAKEVETLKGRLAKADIDNPDRFGSYATLKEVLDNREGANPNDPRPVAVYVFPKEDPNGAFTLDNFGGMSKAYRVMYYEAQTDTNLADDIKAGTERKKASVVILGGHGAQTLMTLGNPVPGMLFNPVIGDPKKARDPRQEPFFLDFSDGAKMRAAGIADRIEPGAQVILKSCEVGKTRSNQANLANFVASLLPKANIWAMTESSNNWEQLDAKGKLIGPGFGTGPAGTYHVKPDET